MEHQFSKNKCFSFRCLRALLVATNFFFLIMGLIIATLPVYFHVNQMLKSWPINGAIIAMGAFLVLLAIFGCYGSRKQHQIILFFYMVLLAIVCILTFAFSLAALSMSKQQQQVVLKQGWKSLSNQTRNDFQIDGNCCGFNNDTSLIHPSCDNLPCFIEGCKPCLVMLQDRWFITFRRAIGGFALFVSLLMGVSVYFTSRFRHIRNPKGNGNEFL